MNLQEALAAEIGPIDAALYEALDEAPAPARPAARHILEAGGKRLRPFLVTLFARLFGCAENGLYRLAASMEMLHAATLLHDDVLDGAASRRGRAAAHAVFPLSSVILAGDALLACANAIVASFGDSRLTLSFSRATSLTAAGEILEISRIGRADLSEEEYLEIIRGKTGWLLAESCRMGALFGGADAAGEQAALDFGLNLGVAFQLVDDALDFAPEAITGKPSGGDAREGKFTPPLRLYRDSLEPAARREFEGAFSRREIGEAGAARIAAEIRELGFDRMAREQAQKYLDKARAALALLPAAEERGLLRSLTDYVIRREK